MLETLNEMPSLLREEATTMKYRWKWGTLTDLRVKEKEPRYKQNYTPWLPGGPWIERPPMLDEKGVKAVRKIIECFTLELLTGCNPPKRYGVCYHTCANYRICLKLRDLIKKTLSVAKKEKGEG
jgi:hypothetical protein